VGFRPFVFRLASELGLKGWVNNSLQGVRLEAEGPRPALEKFCRRLQTERPPRSFITSLESSWLDAVGYGRFEIRESERRGALQALVLPDIATCPDCLREIFAPKNRRYFYPFTNCTHCGPRFSIIEALPYDRGNTSMKEFRMCDRCQAEYEDPCDRRFHAQPNACPVCGPHLELWDNAGRALTAAGDDRAALSAAAEAIRRGEIVAVKGVGGFHLMVAAHDDEAVRRLRERKHREEKPLAVMFPSLESLKRVCEVSELESRLLQSPEAPIVLVRRRPTGSPTRASSEAPPDLAPAIAPNNQNIGAILPYAPLHHLLLSLLGFPVVATSGNLSDEPICTDEREALERLRQVADMLLVHNRPIVRHVDDSIVRIMGGRELVLRRARGYAPLPIRVQNAECEGGNAKGEMRHTPSILAVGAHLKNAVALSVGPQVFVSQHIGDLETAAAEEAFRRVIADLAKLYGSAPQVIAADAHPDYLSTRIAAELAGRGTFASEGAAVAQGTGLASAPHCVRVQHHLAHVFSCMAENELEPPVMGVSWDGTGYGLDGTVWGGEFFLVTEKSWERFGHFRRFRLPGGEAAVKEPRRTALGLLFELFGTQGLERKDLAPVREFGPGDLTALSRMLDRGLNAPWTSSVGRLFDGVASLAGLRQRVRFEGQAAMELEFAVEAMNTGEAYPMKVGVSVAPEASKAMVLVDWGPLIGALLEDVGSGLGLPTIATRFHNALAEAVVAVAQRAGQSKVVVTGGCFQNRYLTERTILRLEQEGFRPYWHQRIPPNDGGIALGQIIAAWRDCV